MSPPSRGFQPFISLPRNLAPLGYRNYALFWIGYTATHTGRWVEQTGTMWLIYELTASPALLGLLGIARAVPLFVLSPISGVVADRVDQRRLLFTTQALGFFLSLSLGVLILTGRVELWHVYVQVGLQGTITAFDASVRQALFPRLVPRANLPEAVTLSAIAGRSSKMIGPAVGGLAIASWGEAIPFLINAATFLVLMAAVAWMGGVVPRTAKAGSTFRGELTEGLRHIMGAPVLSGLLKLELMFALLQLNPVIITIIGRQVLDVGPEGLGGLLSAPALGSIAAIAGLLVLGQPSRQGRFVVLCTLAYAVGLVGLAISWSYPAALVALVGIGVLDAFVSVTRQSVMQLATPSRMRGRVMANVGTVTRGVSSLAETQSGILAGAIGPQLAVVCAGVILAVAGTATGRTNPALWRFSRHRPFNKTMGQPESLEDEAP
jgi:MFS family permease